MSEPDKGVGPVVVFDDSAPLLDEEREAAAVETGEAGPVVGDSPKEQPRAEKFYSSAEVAKNFFGKSTQWLYWGYRDKDSEGNKVTPVFVYEDGSLIEPIKIGKGNRRRYTPSIIREMALACYRRGNLKEDELREVLGKIAAAEKDELVPVS